jgi:acid phosphatase
VNTSTFLRTRSLALVTVIAVVLVGCAGPPASSSAAATASPTIAASGASGPPRPTPSGTPKAAVDRHIYLIVFENKDFTSVIGDPAAPYLNSLARQYALSTNYHGVSHPSQPNYLALFSGSTQGVDDDGVHDIDAPNLADQVEQARLAWRVYAENVPPGCFQGSSSDGGADGAGTYTRKHNPAISFTSISRDPQRCANITDFSHFDPEAANVSLIVPNACHDMHDCSVADGDAWLKSFLPRIVESDAYARDGLILITFDEEHGKGDANQVATIAISPSIREGTRSDQSYDHYSLLRTIQDRLGLPCLANSCDAQPMSDLVGG